MNTKQVLAGGIEVVVFLFAAFGGFLRSIAPPEEADARFAVGLASFAALMVLLFAKGRFSRSRVSQYKCTWLFVAAVLAGCGIAAGLIYKMNLDLLTFSYPPETGGTQYIRGIFLTQDARSYQKQTGKTIAEVVAAYGGLRNREKIWSRNSIEIAKLLLIINYLLFVIGVAGPLFCLTEGILGRPQKPRASGKSVGKGVSK